MSDEIIIHNDKMSFGTNLGYLNNVNNHSVTQLELRYLHYSKT